MSKAPFREVITIHGKTVSIEKATSPVDHLDVTPHEDMLKCLNVFDERFRPQNYNKADGTPLRLFDAASVKIDLSKRSVEDMGFWHRNVDYNEIIFCVRGALCWETELGTVTLHEGDMILIPKGITHRSMLCDDSKEENVLLELKISDEITYVGDEK